MTTRVLVVDDSALMRKHLREILQEEEDLEVYTARDGQDALDQIAQVDPQVVTLDINMPVMDGLTCLSRIMHESPRPVVMVSSLTEEGAAATFEALELGAVDYIAKPGGTVSLNLKQVGEQIRGKVRGAARSRVNRARGLRERLRAQRAACAARTTDRRPGAKGSVQRRRGVVLVGVSTGGPSTLETILSALPADFPWPIVVAQHMPARFTSAFARRLDNQCALEVREVDGAAELVPGVVLIGKGGADVVLRKRRDGLVARTVPEDDSLWHPSVDRLVSSALDLVEPSDLIGVLLTGMGYDGAASMAGIHAGGGRTIAESEDSAIVFGMPQELIARGGATTVLDAERVAEQLRNWME